MAKLSSKQEKIVEFIRRFQREHHYPPTVRDIVAGCKISSTSVVDYNLKRLEKAGILRRHAGISRGMELLEDISAEGLIKVPLAGQIAAGKPIPVPSADTWNTTTGADTIDVPQELTRGRKDVYALKVKGQSMIDALINDGDIVLLQYVNAVENGETAAVWLKAEKETTLKKVYREPKRVRLQPANTQMQPIYTSPDNIEIQGKVIGVIRKVG